MQCGDVARRMPLSREHIHPRTDEGPDRIKVLYSGENDAAHHQVFVTSPRGSTFAVGHGAMLPAQLGSPAVPLQQLGNRVLGQVEHGYALDHLGQDPGVGLRHARMLRVTGRTVVSKLALSQY